MKKIIFILVAFLLLAPSVSLAFTCDDDPELTADERIACNNYVSIAGKWKFKYTKLKDNCSKRVKWKSEVNENKIRIDNFNPEGWNVGKYRDTSLDEADYENFEYSNWNIISGSKMLWPDFYQADLSPTNFFSEWEVFEQPCNALFYCTRSDYATLNKTPTRNKITGRVIYQVYLLGNKTCQATYKIQGTRRK